jgi:hypothetical protein
MDGQSADNRRCRVRVAGFPVLNPSAERDIKQSMSARGGIQRKQQTLVASLAEIERFPDGQAIDAGNIAALDKAAEAGFDKIDLLETFPRNATRRRFVHSRNAQTERRVHRLMGEVFRIE